MYNQNGDNDMNTIDAILTRKSVRQYSDKDIGEKEIRTILRAGQSGPTAMNKRDWHFLVVKDKETLKNMAGLVGLLVASPLLRATMAILILGDSKASAGDFWEVDCSIAAQNMILAAHELGIGSCWIGTFPQEGKIKAQAKLFNLPDHIIPHSIIAFGYPKDETNFYNIKEKKPELEENKIHMEKW